MKEKLFNQNGFSFIELLVVLVISLAMLLALITMLQISKTMTVESRMRMNLQESSSRAFDKITHEMRLSSPDRIVITNSGNTITFDVPDESDSLDADYSVKWASSHSIQYALGGVGNKQLIRTDTTSSQDNIILNDVTDIDFTSNVSKNFVTVEIQMQKDLSNGNVYPDTPMSFTQEISIRNKL